MVKLLSLADLGGLADLAEVRVYLLTLLKLAFEKNKKF